MKKKVSVALIVFLCAILALSLAFSLAACAGKTTLSVVIEGAPGQDVAYMYDDDPEHTMKALNNGATFSLRGVRPEQVYGSLVISGTRPVQVYVKVGDQPEQDWSYRVIQIKNSPEDDLRFFRTLAPNAQNISQESYCVEELFDKLEDDFSNQNVTVRIVWL